MLIILFAFGVASAVFWLVAEGASTLFGYTLQSIIALSHGNELAASFVVCFAGFAYAALLISGIRRAVKRRNVVTEVLDYVATEPPPLVELLKWVAAGVALWFVVGFGGLVLGNVADALLRALDGGFVLFLLKTVTFAASVAVPLLAGTIVGIVIPLAVVRLVMSGGYYTLLDRLRHDA